jgi:hypothetical protein
MDPQDHLSALLDGVTCTVCEERVPADRVRLLAWRDDLAFLQIDCEACRSTSLGFVMAGARTDTDVAPEAAPAISSDDLLDMHEFLSGWAGDLASVVPPAADQRR